MTRSDSFVVCAMPRSCSAATLASMRFTIPSLRFAISESKAACKRCLSSSVSSRPFSLRPLRNCLRRYWIFFDSGAGANGMAATMNCVA